MCGLFLSKFARKTFFLKMVMSIASSVVPMIDYNRKSFIYMQPIIDRMGILGIDYNRKNPQAKEFHFI